MYDAMSPKFGHQETDLLQGAPLGQLEPYTSLPSAIVDVAVAFDVVVNLKQQQSPHASAGRHHRRSADPSSCGVFQGPSLQCGLRRLDTMQQYLTWWCDFWYSLRFLHLDHSHLPADAVLHAQETTSV